MPTLLEQLINQGQVNGNNLLSESPLQRSNFTTDATPTVLKDIAAPGSILLPDNSIYDIEIHVQGVCTTGTVAGTTGEGMVHSSWWHVDHVSGTFTVLNKYIGTAGGISDKDTSAANWAVDLVDNEPYIDIQVTGDVDMTVMWHARVIVTRTGYL